MRQIAVIGLGNFGYYLGKELYRRGFDVIGLDIQQELVQRVRSEISQAIIADSTEKETLHTLGIAQADLAVVTIGTNMLASILTTFHLKELGVKRVYAKALSEEHGQILERIGADEILFPEKDLALSLAGRIENPNMLQYLPSIKDYGIFELDHIESLQGKNLRELDLINRFNIQVIAIRDSRDNRLTFIPKADYVIRQEDVLVLLCSNKSMQRFLMALRG
ncbi:MAG: TrkA family potassium uptake protein [Syntrophobacteraceae bacterium]|nr:TrkA family potassium uptake protein [Syntrophobacteraceae bacterium]